MTINIRYYSMSNVVEMIITNKDDYGIIAVIIIHSPFMSINA